MRDEARAARGRSRFRSTIEAREDGREVRRLDRGVPAEAITIAAVETVTKARTPRVDPLAGAARKRIASSAIAGSSRRRSRRRRLPSCRTRASGPSSSSVDLGPVGRPVADRGRDGEERAERRAAPRPTQSPRDHVVRQRRIALGAPAHDEQREPEDPGEGDQLRAREHRQERGPRRARRRASRGASRRAQRSARARARRPGRRTAPRRASARRRGRVPRSAPTAANTAHGGVTANRAIAVGAGRRLLP